MHIPTNPSSANYSFGKHHNPLAPALAPLEEVLAWTEQLQALVAQTFREGGSVLTQEEIDLSNQIYKGVGSVYTFAQQSKDSVFIAQMEDLQKLSWNEEVTVASFRSGHPDPAGLLTEIADMCSITQCLIAYVKSK